MALETRVDLVECFQLGDREVAAQRQYAVEANRRVALRQDKAVAVRPVRPGRVDAEDVEIERGQDVGRGQWSAKVTGLGTVDRLDDQASGLLRGRAQGPRVVERDGLHRGTSNLFEEL